MNPKGLLCSLSWGVDSALPELTTGWCFRKSPVLDPDGGGDPFRKVTAPVHRATLTGGAWVSCGVTEP